MAGSSLTYDLADHEDEADGRGDVEFLLGQQFVRTVLARHSRRFDGAVAVGANRPLQLHATAATSHTSIFQGEVWVLLFGVWEGAEEMRRKLHFLGPVCLHLVAILPTLLSFFLFFANPFSIYCSKMFSMSTLVHSCGVRLYR